MAGRAAALDALRAQIREMEGAHAQSRRVPTGLSELDTLVRGLPRPGVVELHGPRGSGRTRLALALVERTLRAGAERVVWVDAERTLYPPAVRALGIELPRLLIVRPPSDRVGWAAEQVVRSGCFPLVVVAESARIGRAGQRWARAAEAGDATVVVVRERPSREVPADVRLAVGRGEVTVLRDRGGAAGRRAPLPAPREGTGPWG